MKLPVDSPLTNESATSSTLVETIHQAKPNYIGTSGFDLGCGRGISGEVERWFISLSVLITASHSCLRYEVLRQECLFYTSRFRWLCSYAKQAPFLINQQTSRSLPLREPFIISCNWRMCYCSWGACLSPSPLLVLRRSHILTPLDLALPNRVPISKFIDS